MWMYATRNQPDPPGSQKANLCDKYTGRQPEVGILKLSELQPGEVLQRNGEGYLAVNVPIHTRQDGSGHGTPNDGRQCGERELWIEDVHQAVGESNSTVPTEPPGGW